MNKIQQAMHNKANDAIGPVEHEIDNFLDNNYKSSFKMDKYLNQLGFKKKVVLIIRAEYERMLEELTSDDPQLVEGYDFMTKGQKTKFIKFVQGLIDGVDKYIANNESDWKADSQMKRMRRKRKKALAARLEEIEANKGRKFRK